MQHRTRPQEVSAADPRTAAQGDPLDRDDKRALAESLAALLASGDAQERRGRPWDITMPAGLDSPRPSQPFEEPLRGMVIREVIEPQIFRHFFGVSARR